METSSEDLIRLYFSLMKEYEEIQKTLDMVTAVAALKGINLAKETGDGNNYITKNGNLGSNPLYFKSRLDKTYAEKIKSNILHMVEMNIPMSIKGTSGHSKYREELIREWADKIIEITGHNRRTAQDVLKGQQDIYADVILIMEEVIPQIDRDDILGKRNIGSAGEFEYVLAKLRKYMNKNRELAKEIEAIINTLIRLLDKVNEKDNGDISSKITPCLEKCIEEVENKK